VLGYISFTVVFFMSRREHPQGRAQRIFRQVQRIERDDRFLERGQGCEGLAHSTGREQQ